MHHTFNVYLGGRNIDTIHCADTAPDEVRRSLISHDGYDPSIYVRACWRKEYIIQGNYGCGWEDVNAEGTRKDAQRSLREYNDNEPSPHRLIVRRVQV